VPTYEYACTACGHRFDAVQRFTDEPLSECPECGCSLRKVYGAVGIVLKGSGFYKTDSRAAASNGSNGSGPKHSDQAAGDSAGSDSGPSTGSDSGSTSDTSGTSDKKDKKDKNDKKDKSSKSTTTAASAAN
jgi:putative FmdB family regulatory protein